MDGFDFARYPRSQRAQQGVLGSSTVPVGLSSAIGTSGLPMNSS